MKTYYFIKISNNNNARIDFMIDFTTMANTNLRMCVIKSQLKAYRKDKLVNAQYKPVWYYLESTDYSFYKIDTQEFDEYHEAKNYALKLYNAEFARMNQDSVKHVPTNNKCVVTF